MLLFNTMRHPQTFLKTSPLADASVHDKLVWLFIALQGEKEYSSRALAAEMETNHISVKNSITTLREAGLLLETVPSSGQRPARLKALEPSG
jgi:biotin operon repressor